MLTPQRRGRFLHAVFQQFFREWEAIGEPITLGTLDRARALFAEVTERLLPTLPELERPLERMRLLGSAAATGLGERVLRLEIERPAVMVERLLECSLDGEVTLRTEAGAKTLRIRGTADRIDLFADGTFRLIDYKTGRAPQRQEALQLPVYTLAATERLKGKAGRDWQASDVGYVAFGQREPFVSMVRKGETLESELEGGAARFLEAVFGIERGEFPPRPTDVIRCEWCGYTAVCRKDYADDE
jgi:putative RecB family exonuclease